MKILNKLRWRWKQRNMVEVEMPKEMIEAVFITVKEAFRQAYNLPKE